MRELCGGCFWEVVATSADLQCGDSVPFRYQEFGDTLMPTLVCST